MKISLKSNLTWIVVFALICAVCAAVILVRGIEPSGGVAVIRLDGDVVREIDLSSLREPLEFTVEDKSGGHNTIRAENGKIAVINADCPDKICVKRGYISGGDEPVVCLPHRLTVSVTGGEGTADAVAGAN